MDSNQGLNHEEKRAKNSTSAIDRALLSLDNSGLPASEVPIIPKRQSSSPKLNPVSAQAPAAKRGLLGKSSKKQIRSSSFTNPNPNPTPPQNIPSSSAPQRPGLYTAYSYDAHSKPPRVSFDNLQHTKSGMQSPQLRKSPRPDYFTEPSPEGNMINSSPMRPASPARAQTTSSAHLNRQISNRSKSKSQLNLVTMSSSPTMVPSSNTTSYNKRRETIGHSPNFAPLSASPTLTGTNPTASNLKSAARGNNISNSVNSANGTGYRYSVQEKAYLKKIQLDTSIDSTARSLGSAIAYSDIESDSDDESDMLPREALGLGGVGTSFDDEYTDNVTSYPFLEASYNHEEMENDESLPERLEWQAMLASVLTGEVVQSEKRRLKTTTDVAMKEDDLWLEIRARMCSRTFEAQKRIIEDSRANVEATLQEIMQFRVSDSSDLKLTLKEVNNTLLKLEYCEQLWQCTKKVKASSALYRDALFQRHVEALTTWSTITEWVFREIHLLQLWTGNEAADPTLPPDSSKKNSMIEASSLVERVLKQEDLMKVFDEKIKLNIGPVIQRAREGHLYFREEFNQIGLPVYVEGLEKLMKFPIKLIQEIVSLRLVYAKRMTNPTMMLVDQMIEDLSLYMNIALLVKERNMEYTLPVPDVTWITYTPDSLFDKTVLDCVSFFFELSSSKFMDNSLSQVYRGFNEIDKFLDQYRFLEQVGRYLEGGEIVVANQSW